MNIERIRLLAKAERLMDSGEIPWVWTYGPNGMPERFSVAPEIMKMLELEQGQTINSYIVDAIAELSLEMLKRNIEQMKQDIEDSILTKDFDFRKEMNK